MIDYSLAKKLKDAGFHIYSNDKHGIVEQRPEPENHVYYPTLSELIEACVTMEPFRYFALEKHSNDWRAGFLDGGKFFVTGPTPEEAVANLWLELNKKNPL